MRWGEAPPAVRKVCHLFNLPHVCSSSVLPTRLLNMFGAWHFRGLISVSGLRIQDSGFRIQGSGFGVGDSGLEGWLQVHLYTSVD